MDNQSQSVDNQPNPNPVPTETPKPSKHIVISTIAVLLFLGATATAAYFYLQTQSLKQQLNQAPPITPTPLPAKASAEEDDPTADWQIYASPDYHFSFKYPSDFNVEVRNPGFFVLVSASDSAPQAGISFDFRNLKTFTSPDEALTYYISTLVNTKQTSSNNWIIVSGKGKDAMTQDTKFLIALNTQNTVPVVETIDTTPYNTLLPQILSTFEFTSQTDTTTPQPTTKPAKTLTYRIPSGWQTIGDASQTFTVAYNPETHNAQPYQGSIDLYSKHCCSSLYVRLLPYSGGSRHEFIRSQNKLTTLNSIYTSKTYEQEYLVSGHSTLTLYNVDASSTIAISAMVVSSNQAILITSQSNDPTLMEQTLASIKLQ